MQEIITLIDRIILFLRSREEKKRKLFSEIIDPLFKELEVVTKDYLELFRLARQLIADGNQHEQAADVVRTRRDEMLLARIKVRELAAAIKDEFQESPIMDFAEAVQALFYFSTWTGNSQKGRHSVGHILCDLMLFAEKGDIVAAIIDRPRSITHPATAYITHPAAYRDWPLGRISLSDEGLAVERPRLDYLSINFSGGATLHTDLNRREEEVEPDNVNNLILRWFIDDSLEYLELAWGEVVRRNTLLQMHLLS